MPTEAVSQRPQLETVILVLLTLLLIVQLAFSLGWRMALDTPMLLYIAHLINDHHLAPYHDIFDFNSPGTHLFFIGWERLFGTGDLGFRLLDLIWLAGVFAVTALILKPMGRRAVWVACLLVGLTYVAWVPIQSMQREWIMTLPLAIAAWLTLTAPRSRTFVRLGVGFLIGVVFTLKPQGVIVWPAFALYELSYQRQTVPRQIGPIIVRLLEVVSLELLGFLAAVAPVVWWLQSQNGLQAFLNIASNYWPLYTRVDGGHFTVSGLSRFENIVLGMSELGKLVSWFMAVGLGAYLYWHQARADGEINRRIALLAAIAILFGIYPAISNKFWYYHWMIFQYFLVVLFAALYHNRHSLRAPFGRGLLPLAVLLAALALGPRLPLSPHFYCQLSGQPRLPNRGRTDEIARFLTTRLRAGDTVQPLDGAGGALHAMLQAGALPATRFLSDFYFYHHTDRPYIKGLRSQFISELQQGPAKFIIQVIEDRVWPSGPDASNEFPELQEFISADYIKVLSGAGYSIWQRRDMPDETKPHLH